MSTNHHCSTTWHQTSDNDDGVVCVVWVLVVQDAEPQTFLPLDQGDLLHPGGPGGRIREDLQGSRPKRLYHKLDCFFKVIRQATYAIVFAIGGNDFLKKALKPLKCIGALSFLAILMLMC